jgi:hypothetical protein
VLSLVQARSLRRSAFGSERSFSSSVVVLCLLGDAQAAACAGCLGIFLAGLFGRLWFMAGGVWSDLLCASRCRDEAESLILAQDERWRRA